MAFAEVGSGSQRASVTGDNVDSQALAFPGNVTSGSLLIVAGSNYHSGGSTISVTDSRSTSYTVLQAALSTNYQGWIAYGVAPSSGACTVTVDPTTTGNYVSYSIDEFSGPHATPLDVDGGSSTGTDTAPVDAITTLAENDLIIGLLMHDASGTYALTPSGSYTQIGEEQDNNTHTAYNAVFRIVTTAQAYNVDWTVASSVTWRALTAAFKPSVASPKGLILLMGDGGFM